MCGLCEGVSFVICVFVWVFECVGGCMCGFCHVCMCGFCNVCLFVWVFIVCVCVCVGFVIFGRVYVERITLTESYTSVHQTRLN